jgi:hypothetical protein
MQKLLTVCAVLLFVASARAELLLYEPFDYSSSGSPSLRGQANTQFPNNASFPATWAGVPTTTTVAATAPQIGSGNLSFTGFSDNRPSVGNLSFTSRGGSASARVGFGDGAGSFKTVTTGSVYYSFLFKVSDATSYGTAANASSTSGSFIAGFSPSTGTGGNLSPGIAAVTIRRDISDTSKVDLGIAVRDLAGFRSWVTTKPLTLGDTYLVVGKYQYNNSSTTDDVASIWINQTDEGTPDQTSSGEDVGSQPSNNIAAIASFFLRNNGSEPDQTLFDEVRVGTTWDDVVPEPASIAIVAIWAVPLLTRRRRRRIDRS